jgi:hypothetical protein
MLIDRIAASPRGTGHERSSTRSRSGANPKMDCMALAGIDWCRDRGLVGCISLGSVLVGSARPVLESVIKPMQG